MDLAGQAVIVTGSSSGIGEAVARRLAGLARVSWSTLRRRSGGQQVAADLRRRVVQGDIGDPATAAALIAAAEQRWGRLDGLVNNAGVTVDVPLPTSTPSRSNTGTGCCAPMSSGPSWSARPRSRCFGRPTTAGSSTSARSPASGRRQFAAVRGLEGRDRSHDDDHGQARRVCVRINAVAPGLVATPWTEGWGDEGWRGTARAVAPRHNRQDIADAMRGAYWPRYVTGQTLVVDGGLGLVI